MNDSRDFLIGLERSIREEARYGWDRAHERWERPLLERVATCRAIGPLTVAEREAHEGKWFIHFHPSEEDIAFFREEDRLRLSRDAPNLPGWIPATFIGLTPKGLTVMTSEPLSGDEGWTLDEEYIDLSPYYLKALEELAKSEHGRSVVLPILQGQVAEADYDLDAYEEAEERLREEQESEPARRLNDSQVDAVARCLASPRIHLVQGPPGTGKTHVLAELVRELVDQGQRVLVSAFTHRAIHHALRQIRKRVSCPVYKVSLPLPEAGDLEIHPSFAATGLMDDPGPYVIGVTPISLFTSRAEAARFDVAVIDETSQMKVEAAMMPMLRAERFFFFGDHQQLPPVVQQPVENPAEHSIFMRLAAASAKGHHRTLLRTTYRLNAPLAEWPSEHFYGGELESEAQVAEHRFMMKRPPMDDAAALLAPEPSCVRREFAHTGCRASSAEEADAAAALIEAMLAGGVPAAEIGVVVPFRAQAARIRKLLRFARFARYPEVRQLAVDTVERFQGQEREAMIVSFAVSDPEFMERLASFLTFPQRLNVAVTRARTKVILLHSQAFRRWLESRAVHDEAAALVETLFRSAGESR